MVDSGFAVLLSLVGFIGGFVWGWILNRNAQRFAECQRCSEKF